MVDKGDSVEKYSTFDEKIWILDHGKQFQGILSATQDVVFASNFSYKSTNKPSFAQL